jgi:A/G-specific adenine glycosylase
MTSRPPRDALLAWYDAHRRDLPWRRTRDPYAVWISEAMLQQTRVETVIPYYERFLTRFPDVASLASSDTEEVLSAWAGLGYYSRARNLRAAAQAIVDEHGGRLPDTAAGLRSLPGIGRYTAGAIASIAFDRPEPVLDGNVARVLARWLGVRDDVRRREVEEQLWRAARDLVPGPRPGDLNQALMELGATLCTPRAPRCADCPWSRGCDARRAGDAEVLPLRSRPAEPKRVEAAAAVLERRGRVLAVRRPPRGLLGGLWELPGGDLRGRERPARGLLRALRERLGLALDSAARLELLGSVDHAYSHRFVRLHVFRAAAPPGRVRLEREGLDAHRWVAPARFEALPQGRLARKAWALARG